MIGSPPAATRCPAAPPPTAIDHSSCPGRALYCSTCHTNVTPVTDGSRLQPLTTAPAPAAPFTALPVTQMSRPSQMCHAYSHRPQLLPQPRLLLLFLSHKCHARHRCVTPAADGPKTQPLPGKEF
eukprot:334139-Prorocentrum_minimum.AAC.1